MLKQNSASHVGSTQYAFLVRYVYPYASHITKEFISKMYFVNCGIILVPKFCIFSRQCEHNTNVGTDALRNWDQYKSQMYYINSGFILVPKFCSMQMRSWNELQYGCIFFCISQRIHPKCILARFGTNIVHMCQDLSCMQIRRYRRF